MSRGLQEPGKTGARLIIAVANASRGLRVSWVRGALGGPGPRALRARCVRRTARKTRGAGAARLRGATSPPPLAPWGFGRQGAGAGGAGVYIGQAGANRVDRCPEAIFWMAPGASRYLTVGCRPSSTRWKKLRGFRAPAAALPFGMPAL